MGIQEKYQLPAFFIITYAISSAIVGLAVLVGNIDLTIFAVLGTTLTAILLTSIVSGKSGVRQLFARQSERRVGLRWYLISIFLASIIAYAAIGIDVILGLHPEIYCCIQGFIDFHSDLSLYFPAIIIILLISIGEEFGWRGFALPRLQARFSAITASIILGLLHGMWHYPAFLAGTGTLEGVPFFWFMMWVMPSTILMTWVYNNTRRVLVAILFHSGSNAAFGFVPFAPVITGDLSTYFIFLGLVWITTIIVIVVYGPARLIRKPKVMS